MSKISTDMNSMMVALRQSRKLGCRSAHRTPNGWQPCSSSDELDRIKKLDKPSATINKPSRVRTGTNNRSTQWEQLTQRGVAGIATLDGGGLVSASFSKAARNEDLETYDNIETARQRSRQLGCIGVARRYTSTGKEIWTPCTNMSDLSRVAGLTSLGRKRQRDYQERVITEALRKRKLSRRPNIRKKDISPAQFGVKKLTGRLGGGLRVPPPGMVFQDISGAIDGDRDGIINEGELDERPIVPIRMISEAVAQSLPQMDIATSSPLSSISLIKPTLKQRRSIGTKPSIRMGSSVINLNNELAKRLDNEETAFLRRLVRNPGYAAEVPDHILFAGGPEFLERVRQQNIKAHVSGLRSMTDTKPSGGRAMSDLIMGRIEPSEFGKSEPTMYFIGGTMGAGKSTVVSKFPDVTGIPVMTKAAHIDPDEIKSALPGWNNGKGASAVHQTSRVVTDKILDRALSSAVDVVIQGTGKRDEHLASARRQNYKTVGHYVWVPSEESKKRIIQRSSKPGATQVDPGLGPLIARELQGTAHRQVTSGLLDEFYLWDTRSESPQLIAYIDGDGVYEINDMDSFYDFFGQYGGDRVKAHWGAIGKKSSSTGQRSTTRQRPVENALVQETLSDKLEPRYVANGFSNKINPLTARDLSDINLKRSSLRGTFIRSGENLQSLDASFIDASRVNAVGVKFSGSLLMGGIFERANLHNSDFGPDNNGRSSNLMFVDFGFSTATQANFSKASMFGANLAGANMQGAVLRNADMRMVNLFNTDLRGADLTGADIDPASLMLARLDTSTILPSGERADSVNIPPVYSGERSHLTGLRHIPIALESDPQPADISKYIVDDRLIADGRGLMMQGLQLDRRDMRNSQLSNIMMPNSELERADLSGSTLSGVAFNGSMMDHVRLVNSNLANVNMSRIHGKHINMSGSTLNNVKLTGATLIEARLENVVVQGDLDLRGADLRGANLSGADLRRATIDDTTKLDGIKFDRRTKFPLSVNMSRIGPNMRSRTQRDFNDFLLAEVNEDERYQRRPVTSGQILRSTGLTTQPDFVRGSIIKDALARLLARDVKDFGPHLSDRDHKNISHRMMMLDRLYRLAEDGYARARAAEISGILPRLTRQQNEQYINDASWGVLANDLRMLKTALEYERPSTLNNANDIYSFVNERAQKLMETNEGRSSLDELNNRYQAKRNNAPSEVVKRSRSALSADKKLTRLLASSNQKMEGMRSTARAQALYEETTKQIIDALENAKDGKWERPWAFGFGLPRNASTGKTYKGWNVFWLNISSRARGYEKPVWATYKQWAAMGGQVRKGETGIYCEKWVPVLATDKSDPTQKISTGRMKPFGFTVFNLDQVDGVERSQFDVEALSETERIERMETILSEIDSMVMHGDPNRAYYAPDMDVINMPPFGAFKTAAAYYATLAHETIHWTGGASRLGRDNMHAHGTPQYAYEELVAEIGSALFMSLMGIEQQIEDNHVQYLKSWLSILRNDPEKLTQAIRDAQKAVDFIIELSPTLKRDMTPIEPDSDIMGDASMVDGLDDDAKQVTALALRSLTRSARQSEYPDRFGHLMFATGDKTPLSIDEVASMPESKLGFMLTEDRMKNLSARELAEKYHLSERDVLEYIRTYLRQFADDVEGVRNISEAEKSANRTLPILRNGTMQRLLISELRADEAETALQYVRREIQRAKNARELRSQRSIEEALLKRLSEISKSS